MTASKSSFSPQMMEILKSKSRFITEGSKAVNMFSKFPGPDGDYYAYLHKIVWDQEAKKETPVVRFAFVTIAAVEDSSTEFGALPVRIQFFLRESAKSSEQDAWDRLYTQGYQALGCNTAAWASLQDENGIPISIYETLDSETIRLNKEHPCVVLSIKANEKDTRYHNVNIREVLRADALSHLTIPKIDIDDSDISKDDETVDQVDETSQDEATNEQFQQTLEDAKSVLIDCDIAGCIVQARASDLDLDYDTMEKLTDLKAVRNIILTEYVRKAGYEPDQFNLSFSDEVPFDTEYSPEPEVVSATLNVESGETTGIVVSDGIDSVIINEVVNDLETRIDEQLTNGNGETDHIRETLTEALEGSGAEPEQEEDGADPLVAMDRKQRIAFIRQRDAEAKIYKSHTDDQLLSWVRELAAKEPALEEEEE